MLLVVFHHSLFGVSNVEFEEKCRIKVWNRWDYVELSQFKVVCSKYSLTEMRVK